MVAGRENEQRHQNNRGSHAKPSPHEKWQTADRLTRVSARWRSRGWYRRQPFQALAPETLVVDGGLM
jgi:hypothetical protein